MCLCLDICSNQFSAAWIKGNLAGGIDELARAYSLTIWANGRRGMGCTDLRMLHNYFRLPTFQWATTRDRPYSVRAIPCGGGVPVGDRCAARDSSLAQLRN